MRKALFLDRDGIVNVDKKYIHKIEEFEFIEGIFELCEFFMDKGFLICIVTNQAGIGRGYYSEQDFSTLTQWMKDTLAQKGIIINDVAYCPHHLEHGIGKYKIDCGCRKPKPGMILRLAQKHNINLKSSVLIGDKESDIKAGISAYIDKSYLIKSTYQKEYDFETIRDLLNYLKETNL